ncbi:restriction endonuclease subunit S [Hahella aquimaris]|uniref:restriction endonuclease subunit S n=1 Tax=Hahella sp. HNIBRBA332 TaxID=3015983 RepID=UPI00273C6E96|nr:restriction endonuclease subunit S [Hahella sp. HNIBRBA332]WLQ14250.1 restriction endonuclease subunit S [Hahella sp. HNIBRBA332]
MVSDWKHIPLGELITLQRGHDLPSQDRRRGNIPVMGSSGLTGHHDTPRCIGPGVVIGRSGNSMGVVSYCEVDYWPLNTALYITDFKGNDPRYIYYLLSLIKFDQFNSGSAQKSLNRNAVYPFRVWATTNVKTQRRIGQVLEAFEQQIELNRQINTTLESMAQALFKSWFVDFDPVIDNALAAGHPIPEELQAKAQRRAALGDQRQPLPAEIQKLFPSSFVFNEELGWVPEGWEVIPISRALSINPRVTIKKGKTAKYADMKALPTSGYIIEDIIEKAFSGGAKFENNDVLLARITPCLENGKTGIVDFLDEGEAGFGSTEFIVLRESIPFKMPFIAALARHEPFRQHCILNMIGSSGRQRVQNACFDSYYLVAPREDQILMIFDKQCEPYFKKMSIMARESSNLGKLRDTLLPKLLSGQLQIPYAEAAAENTLETL